MPRRRSRSGFFPGLPILLFSSAIAVCLLAALSWGILEGNVPTLVSQGAAVWAVVSLAVCIVACLGKRPVASILAAGAFLSLCLLWTPKRMGGILLRPSVVSGLDDEDADERAPAPSDAPLRVRLLQLNVWGRNHDLARLDDLLTRWCPDVVTLQECGDSCFEGRQKTLAIGGYYAVRSEEGRIAIFARGEISAPDVGREPARLSVDVALDRTRKARIAVVHLDRPWPFGDGPAHARQIAESFALSGRTTRPFVLAGDFNAAPWTPVMYEARTRAELDETRLPGLPLGTWPALVPGVGLPFPLPLVPIDSVFVGNGLVTLASRVGPNVGSDHRPLLVTLALP